MLFRSPAEQFGPMTTFWLLRVVTLAILVGVWLLNAHGVENRRVADELRARGRTTVAKDPYRNPRERWEERSRPDPYPTRAYLFVVDGVEYRRTTTKEGFDPVGKTVTYLPEDPNVHQVGDILPEPGMPWWGYGVLLLFAAGFGLVTVAFFLLALLPPGEPEPTRAGWWCIVTLAAIQFTAALVTTTFFRVPFQTLLMPGVPLFVGGTVLAVAGVRLSAWGWGVALREPDKRVRSIPTLPAAGTVATGPAPERPRPAGWGEARPARGSVPPGRSGWYLLLAIPAGASGCLALAVPTLVLMHLVAAAMTWLGATTSFNAFFTGRDSVLFDLIFALVAAVFGGMRGVAHEAEAKGRPAPWKGFWADVAGKSATDLATIRTSERNLESMVTLLFAVMLSAPIAVVLVLAWNG
jgi:hypothetical protein